MPKLTQITTRRRSGATRTATRSQTHTATSRRTKLDSTSGSRPPRVFYRVCPEVLGLRMRPSAIRRTWAVIRRKLEVTAPELIEQTGQRKKTVESHLWHLKNLGIVNPIPIRRRRSTAA